MNKNERQKKMRSTRRNNNRSSKAANYASAKLKQEKRQHNGKKTKKKKKIELIAVSLSMTSYNKLRKSQYMRYKLKYSNSNNSGRCNTLEGK